MRLLRWIKWKLSGSPIIHYEGCNCGCCGKWVDEPFQIRTIDSAGEWWDTWGLCKSCAGEGEA